MLQKNKKKNGTIQSVRPRQSKPTLSGSFRRNTVVVSHRQRALAARQESVMQRQLDQKRHQARRRVQRRVIVTCALLAFGFFFYRMQVTGVNITSNASTKLESRDVAAYEQSILSEYQKVTLLGQSWLADTRELAENIQAQYPEIQHIQFELSNPIKTTIHADIRFRKPVFTWQDVGQASQFVDEHGVLFDKNLSPTTDTAKLIRIEDQSGAVLDAGTSVLTTQNITFIGQLHGKIVTLYGQGSGVEKVIIPRSTREVQIKMRDISYSVKFNATRTVDEQIGELQVLLAHLKEQNVTPGEYIDLRVAHKAFYR